MKKNSLKATALAVASVCLSFTSSFSQSTTASNTLTGSPTVPTQYLGSANNFDLLFKTNNVERMRLSTAKGYLGIGTTVPAFNMHVHGAIDYISPAIYDRDGGMISASYNMGKTSRIGLTNATTGYSESDGTIIRMSENNFVLSNYENGNILINTGGAQLNFNGNTNKTYFGNPTQIAGLNYAYLNTTAPTSDNGLFVRTTASGKYGIGIKVNANNDNAIESYGANAAIKTFTVQGSGSTTINASGISATGNVFLVNDVANKKILQLTNDGILRSRQIIVDQLNWADYVFKPEYKLMSLDQVKNYISDNGHLPNIPSAEEIATSGLNVAQIETKLMEKIEELTLYILQQEERMKSLEQKNEDLGLKLNTQQIVINELKENTSVIKK